MLFFFYIMLLCFLSYAKVWAKLESLVYTIIGMQKQHILWSTEIEIYLRCEHNLYILSCHSN